MAGEEAGGHAGGSPNRSATRPESDRWASAPEDAGHDLPLDAHLHTDQSPDSSVPIDVYAALAVERGIPEICITDHVDFDPRDPAYQYTRYQDRERVVRRAAERWADQGVTIRFGAELTYNRRWEDDVRAHLARYRYDYVIGSVHDWPESPYWPSRVRAWIEGRTLDEVLEPYYTEIIAAARSGLFDTIGHLDVVKRYLHPSITAEQLATRRDLQEPALRAIVESGVALEVNSSGLRYPGAETYPSGSIVARYRELGGERVVVGSDAHTRGSFAHRLGDAYQHLREAGFGHLTFRRGSDRVRIDVPGGTHIGTADRLQS
jgi:histidinol-phosphatase (PHP family)